MNRGKCKNARTGRKRNRKPTVLLASLVLLCTLAVGTTVAYIVDATSQVVNTFQPVTTSVDVTESFDHREKKEIKITNGGDIDVYIRATLAMYWTDSNGVIVKPTNCSYSGFTLNTGWIQVGDIFYYSSPVAPNTTVELLKPGTSITATISPEQADYRFVVEVMTEAIQADPTDAVEDAWKDVNVSGGKLVSAANS